MSNYLKKFLLLFSFLITSIAFAIPVTVNKNEQGQYFLEDGQQIYTQVEVDKTVKAEIQKFKSCVSEGSCTIEKQSLPEVAKIRFWQTEKFMNYMFLSLKILAGIFILAGLIYTIAPLKIYFMKLMVHLDFVFQKIRAFIVQFFKLGIIKRIFNAIAQGFLFIVRQLRKIPTEVHLAILSVFSFIIMKNPDWFAIIGFKTNTQIFITSIFYALGSLLLIGAINYFEDKKALKDYNAETAGTKKPNNWNNFFLYNAFALALIAVISQFAFTAFPEQIQMPMSLSIVAIFISALLLLNSYELPQKILPSYNMTQFVLFTIASLIVVPYFFPELTRLNLVFQIIVTIIALTGFCNYILPFSSNIFGQFTFRPYAFIIALAMIGLIGFSSATIPAIAIIFCWIVFIFIRIFMLLTKIHIAVAFIMSGALLYWATTYIEANGAALWVQIKQIFIALI